MSIIIILFEIIYHFFLFHLPKSESYFCCNGFSQSVACEYNDVHIRLNAPQLCVDSLDAYTQSYGGLAKSSEHAESAGTSAHLNVI